MHFGDRMSLEIVDDKFGWVNLDLSERLEASQMYSVKHCDYLINGSTKALVIIY